MSARLCVSEKRGWLGAAILATLAAGCRIDSPAGADWNRSAYLRERGSATTRVVQLAAGNDHTCALRSDGSVACWGTGAGRLGPRDVAAVRGAVSIAAHGDRTCAVGAKGELSCWVLDGAPRAIDGVANAERVVLGRDRGCVLIHGGAVRCFTLPSDGAPPVVTTVDLRNVVELAAGDAHVCARLGDASVRCWGKNDVGQLGDGSTTSTEDPVEVEMDGAIGIAAQASASCAWAWDGNVFCWGGAAGVGSRTPIGIPFTDGARGGAFAAGAGRLCAWFQDGRVRCAGADRAVTVREGAHDVVQIVAGQRHFCSLDKGGAVDCWGENDRGQLADVREARTKAATAAEGVVAVAAHRDDTCALVGGGSGLACFSGGASLANKTDIVWAASATKVGATGVALNGSVVCLYGPRGVACGPRAGSSPHGPAVETFVDETTGDALDVVAFDLGVHLACAVTSDGRARCLHTSDLDEPLLGPTERGRFVKIDQTPMLAAVAVERETVPPGDARTAPPLGAVGITRMGDLWDLSAVARDARFRGNARRLQDFASADDARLDGGWFCARGRDGAVRWGRTADGGGSTLRAVDGLGPTMRVDASAGFACALVANGNVRCWGENGWGQLGDGAFDAREDARDVLGVRGATAIAVGGRHACARRSDGSLACWGYASDRPRDGWREEASRVPL